MNMKRKKSKKQVIIESVDKGLNNLIVISDLHVGCQFGLCPPDGVQLDGGGHYTPNRVQIEIWKWWREFWGNWVPMVCRSQPFAVCLNGDTIDGRHHNATHQWSHNLADQQRAAVDILKPIVNQCGGRFWLVRGTEAHTGSSSEAEEKIAQTLGAIPRDGVASRYELWVRVGEGLCHLLHHIGTTSSAQHEAAAINAELTREFVEAARWNERPPNVVVRSHRHQCAEVAIPSATGQAISIVTPAWQAKTPYAFRAASSRMTEPQIGGLLVRYGSEDGAYVRSFVRHPQRDQPE
jgi:hypothetical protein